jgi:putative ABC transport system permease protein
MQAWFDDLIQARRSFRQAPWFFAGLTFVLALGTGANAAVFSLVQAVLLQPLPYERPQDVVMVWNARNAATNWRMGATVQSVTAWRDSSGAVLTDVAVFKLSKESREASIDLVLDDRAERLRAGIVTSNFFRVLGVSAAIGRVFSPDDESAGQTDVVVISHALWARAFGADPAIVGRQLLLTTGDGRDRRPRSYLVAGVLPQAFKFTYPLETELWAMDTWATVKASPRGAILFNGAVARLKPGVPLPVAAARMADIPARPGRSDVPVERRELTRIEPVSEWVVGSMRPSLLLLAGTSLILLVITCATVASALLVRLAERRRELAVRAALGADRLRLAREAIGEAVLLSLSGTAAGFLLAVAILPVFRALVPSVVPRADEIGINLWLMVFAVAVASVVTMLSALVPALQASGIDVASALKSGAGTISADRPALRLRNGLILGQTAIATCLLVASVLLAMSFWRLGRVDLGFDGDDVLTVEMRLREPRYFAPDVKRRLQDDLLARVRAIPGVLEAGLTTAVPFRGVDWVMSLPRVGGGRRVVANGRMVDAPFFSIMKIPLRRGRLFTPADTPSSPRVAVVSESFAREMFGGEDPLGRAFDDDGPVEVVGIVGDLRYVSLDQDARPAFYFARSQQPSELMCLVLRTAPAASNMGAAVRAAIREVDPTLPPMNITTVDRIISESVADRRFYTTTTVAFAVLALLLTATALVIVIARAAVERRRELAIRAAIGAQSRHLTALVAKQATVPVVLGVASGLGAAWFGTRILQQFLFQIQPREPLVYAAACGITLAIAALSSILPARRASTLPPAIVLRGE